MFTEHIPYVWYFARYWANSIVLRNLPVYTEKERHQAINYNEMC